LTRDVISQIHKLVQFLSKEDSMLLVFIYFAVWKICSSLIN
jgi:hypothetical protein